MRENRFLLFLNQLRLAYSIPKSFALLLNIHRLRHSFAVLALQQGKTLHVISQLLWHSSIIATEKTYAQFLPSSLDQEVDSINFNFT